MEVWIPLAFDAGIATNRGERFLQVLARLAPRVTIQQAQAALNGKALRGAEECP